MRLTKSGQDSKLERCHNCQRFNDGAIPGTQSLSGWLCTYCEQHLNGYNYIRHTDRTIARLSAENSELRQALLQTIELDAHGST